MRTIPLFLLALAMGMCNAIQAQNNTTYQRIITAGSAISEVVVALGHGDKIIATDRTSTFPARLQRLPSIGYRNNISAENIISQNPDLILTEKKYIKPEIVEQLRSVKIDFHEIIDPLSFAETKAMIRQVAGILNESEKGELLINEMDAKWAMLSNKIASINEHPSIIFIMAHNGGNPMIAGHDTFVDELFKMAGAVNGTASIHGFKPLNTESLIKADPDFILFGDRNFDALGGATGASQLPGISYTKAGKNNAFVSLDLVMISNFGPRLIEAVEQLANAIHPQLSNSQ